MTGELTSEMWVSAHVRKCNLMHMPAFVVNRGDRERGGILVKVNRFGAGCGLYQPQTDMDGLRFWMPLLDEDADEKKADETIRKRLAFDSDLWVIEIEDQQGTHEFDAPVRSF